MGSRAVRSLMLLETSSPSRITIRSEGGGAAASCAGPASCFDGATFKEARVPSTRNREVGAAGSSSAPQAAPVTASEGSEKDATRANADIREVKAVRRRGVVIMVQS